MSITRPRRGLASVAVAIVASAVPAIAAAQAGAATLSVGSACYVNASVGVGAPITVTGSGFIRGTRSRSTAPGCSR